MQIPGLSAPIPPGAQFGYQPGGWGKPPVDEEGNPLYGDVFGQFEQDADDENVRTLPPVFSTNTLAIGLGAWPVSSRKVVCSTRILAMISGARLAQIGEK